MGDDTVEVKGKWDVLERSERNGCRRTRIAGCMPGVSSSVEGMGADKMDD